MARCGRIRREPEFAVSVDCGWVSWSVGMLLVKPLKWTFSTLLGIISFIVLELEKMAKLCWSGQKLVSALSDVETGVYQLQRCEKQLRQRVQKLNLEANRCKEEARFLLRSRKKSQALRCLRGCNRLERRADSLLVKLEMIRKILDRIAQSQTDKMVLQAYQAGVFSLRTVERAESLVDQIQELFDTQDEVNEIISSGVMAAEDDMDELEEELKTLLDDY